VAVPVRPPPSKVLDYRVDMQAAQKIRSTPIPLPVTYGPRLSATVVTITIPGASVLVSYRLRTRAASGGPAITSTTPSISRWRPLPPDEIAFF
jgi:hypothetical protein